jgi:hypothetical protein
LLIIYAPPLSIRSSERIAEHNGLSSSTSTFPLGDLWVCGEARLTP